MKVVQFIESLFNPVKMPLRKNMNMFVSFLILIIASYIIAVPYMSVFEKNAYETYCVSSSYNFRIFDEETSKEVAFTDEEKTKFGDEYVFATVEDLKKLDFVIEGNGIKLPNNANSLEEIEFNHKEYLLKREVYYFDNDGTKLDKVDVYYVHIVFDFYTAAKDATYTLTDDFDKKLNFNDENHYVFAFLYNGFTYRNEYMIDNNIGSYIFKYSDVKLDLKEMDTLDYLTKNIAELLIPETKSQYTYIAFLYTVFSPLILALIAFVFVKRKSALVKFKHYFNVATLCSIPVTVLFFIIEWIPFFISIGIMELYWIVLAIYYFVVLSVINRTNGYE